MCGREREHETVSLLIHTFITSGHHAHVLVLMLTLSQAHVLITISFKSSLPIVDLLLSPHPSPLTHLLALPTPLLRQRLSRREAPTCVFLAFTGPC